MSLLITWERTEEQRDPEGGDLLDTTTGEISVDVVISSEYLFGGEQTKRPIEGGAPATDHWRRGLDKLRLQCAHTNTPPNTSGDVTVQDVSLPGGGKAMMGTITAGGETSRILGLLDDLHALVQSGALVDVTGLDRSLSGWRMLSVTVTQEPGQTGLCRFNMELEEVIFSVLETVDAPAPRRERARLAADSGANRGTETAAPAPETNQSFLASIRDRFAGTREAMGNR